jgi:hypothetical protein
VAIPDNSLYAQDRRHPRNSKASKHQSTLNTCLYALCPGLCAPVASPYLVVRPDSAVWTIFPLYQRRPSLINNTLLKKAGKASWHFPLHRSTPFPSQSAHACTLMPSHGPNHRRKTRFRKMHRPSLLRTKPVVSRSPSRRLQLTSSRRLPASATTSRVSEDASADAEETRLRHNIPPSDRALVVSV